MGRSNFESANENNNNDIANKKYLWPCQESKSSLFTIITCRSPADNHLTFITREYLMLLNLYYLYGISSIVIERFAHILTSMFPVLQHVCNHVSQ